MRFLSITLMVALLAGARAAAQSAGEYGPFNPVPDAQLRAMSPDRPGKSSGVVTVDAGHWQLEADFFNYAEGTSNGVSFDQWSAPNLVLKYGLSQGIDLEAQISGENHIATRDEISGARTTANGIGDAWLGAKFNIFGNDPGDGPQNQGFAIIPLIKIPTAAAGVGNGKIEYSVALPYQFSLPSAWSLTLENADGLRVDHSGNGLVGDYQGMINLSHPLFSETVTASVELAYDHNADPVIGNALTFDPALQWFVKPNLALDVGDYVGLNSRATAENPYLGISTRF